MKRWGLILCLLALATTGAIGLPALLPPFLRLDYVWHSAQFLGGRLGSDRLPVVVTLEVQPD